MLLGTVSGGAAIAAMEIGTGRSVYLGPIYAGVSATSGSGYPNLSLRSGAADRLLEQAVAWAAEGPDEFDVRPAEDVDAAPNAVRENSGANVPMGITARTVDDDATNNAVTYSLADDAGGRFQIDASTGVVSTTGVLIDREAAASYDITVEARSSDGSSSTADFTIAVLGADEDNVAPVIEWVESDASSLLNKSVDKTVQLTGSFSDVGTLDTHTVMVDWGDGTAPEPFLWISRRGLIPAARPIPPEASTR